MLTQWVVVLGPDLSLFFFFLQICFVTLLGSYFLCLTSPGHRPHFMSSHVLSRCRSTFTLLPSY